MHIPDGYLSPQSYGPLWGISLVFWSIALKKVKRELSTRQVPYLAMAASFSFLIMMFNIPIPGGTTGHAVGGGIVAIFLGPWTAVIAISVVVMIQAIVFGDGGVTAIGANCFNMAVVMPFMAYWMFRAVNGKKMEGVRPYVAAFVAGYTGLCAAAIMTGFEFGIQPLIARGVDGRPLYAPYPLSVAVPAMAIEHLALFGVIEGIITALLFKYLLRHEPAQIYALRRGDPI
ncbi:MAG TPA: cobalt transporter CbiM [Syntrophorhabdaceae bacterium]|nr:cobalt transporter CbiM [Syntrophorhabdaceae bacterium]